MRVRVVDESTIEVATGGGPVVLSPHAASKRRQTILVSRILEDIAVGSSHTDEGTPELLLLRTPYVAYGEPVWKGVLRINYILRESCDPRGPCERRNDGRVIADHSFFH